ncbi:Eco57I restriction-modification methylase domain-containing protein [Myroides odoratus]
MPLFQKAVLNKYLKSADQNILKEKYKFFSDHFLNSTIQENIRNSKEEQYQEGFLSDLFVNILGYTKNPTPNFNLTTELKNLKDSKKVDGAILINSNTKAVIELKGMNTTDLSSIETQAFGYKNNHSECTYIITSNFQKIRFYIDNAIEYLEFDLFNLSFENFQVLYLCLAFENISKDIPKRIKDESLTEEKDITKKLYKDYSLFKRELYENILQLNSTIDPLLLFKKTQKLIDRFLFLFFAEDRGLLQPNSVRTIVDRWKMLRDLDAYSPLIDNYRKYFGYLNTGYISNDLIVFAYNGGLFAPDEVLDQIDIDDELLKKHTLKIAKYDFASEVDVNILGHIFENSLNELEEVQAEIRGEVVEKTKTKRKKDGVFYTPKYITKYIVSNTVGKLCKDKKAELKLVESDYYSEVSIKKISKKQKEEKRYLLNKLEEYRKWLLQLTICDPACGSGAFLNQALDFLIAEHRYIDELQANLFGDALILTDIEGSILENNLYGVDINEESIEIAKLSLWLRTAEPNRKLTSLSNNLKCGNSLIDDIEVAGEKTFNWIVEFPHIFSKGGFDVIIGNPPYVFARDNFSSIEKDFYVSNYVSAKYQINTYLIFIEKTSKLIKLNGIYGLIIPNSWLMMYSGEGLRKYLLDSNKINQIINLSGYSFESANVETVILLAEKVQDVIDNNVDVLLNNGYEFYKSHSKNQDDFKLNEGYEFKVFVDEEGDSINLKLFNNSSILDDLVDIKAGLQAYEKGKGNPKQTAEDVVNRIYDYSYKFDEFTYKYLEGKDVGRYWINWSGTYLKYGDILAAPRSFNLFNGPKIIIREITGKYPNCIISTFNDEIYLYNRSNIGIVEKNNDINLKYINLLLNSTLLSYYFLKNTAKSVRKMFPKIILNDLRKFPIKKISLDAQQPFIEMANKILTLNKDLQSIATKFSKLLASELELDEPSKKLQEWYKLEFADFVNELNKKKIELSLVQKSEWMDFFETEKLKVNNLQAEIKVTDKQIDTMVYALYDLTPEEIAIVESN